ncbi:hypothetical protein LI410_mgp038 (mitochondrion) [Apium graveolens]|uniref:hypothetical protein n=1 Tax=Apium graveolens TaxID=4045 RepID=UPI001D0053DE|nr:hypothetical protein LI410_mgp038 [Apium graveolens]QVJ97945.1 hypothetical protein [Apium graveolens]QVJ98047.1 hypothetical protein [Apium graveolens]QVJ98067.1 hypothetical protein [Apium graveolens]
MRFVLRPDRDLIAQPPFFFVVLMSLKLEWVVWEIKSFRFIVRFLITAIGLCPSQGSASMVQKSAPGDVAIFLDTTRLGQEKKVEPSHRFFILSISLCWSSEPS